MIFDKYDVIVVGGGHAGCEAATASANMGNKTLLVTMNMNAMAAKSCNPALTLVSKTSTNRSIRDFSIYPPYLILSMTFFLNFA